MKRLILGFVMCSPAWGVTTECEHLFQTYKNLVSLRYRSEKDFLDSYKNPKEIISAIPLSDGAFLMSVENKGSTDEKTC